MIIQRITYFLLFTLLLAGCTSAQKRMTKTPETVAVPEVTEMKSETLLTEDKRNEFEYLFIEGLKQKKLGNTQNAISIFARCLEIDPNSSVAMFEMANIHFANNDLTSAGLLLEKAISINPGNKWYKLLLADIYRQRQQFDNAAALYTQLVKTEPDNLEFLYSRAVFLGMAKKYPEAIEAYNELEKKTGLNEQISVAKQQVYLEMKKPEKAFDEIHKLIESNPQEPQYYGLLAELYQKVGDQENALKNYNKILEIDPENGFVHFSLSNYYFEQNDQGKAFDHIKKAFGSEELDAETKIQYYMLQTADGDSSDLSEGQMEELLTILRKTHPDDTRMYAIYADHLLRQKKPIEARDYLRKYIETDKNSFDIWWQLLLISNELMDFETLYTDSKEAISLFPNQAVLYALNSVASLQLKRYEEALATIEEGETYVLDNQSLKIQFELYKAEANYNLNRVDEAFAAFDKIIKMDPDNYMAMNNYAYYLSIRGKNLEKAERMSGKVVQAVPDNPTYLDTYAWVLFMRENYELARFYIETAINNGGGDNAVLVEHYGDILYKLGEKEKALENWRKAKMLGEGTTEVLDRKIKESRFIENLVP